MHVLHEVSWVCECWVMDEGLCLSCSMYVRSHKMSTQGACFIASCTCCVRCLGCMSVPARRRTGQGMHKRMAVAASSAVPGHASGMNRYLFGVLGDAVVPRVRVFP